MLTTVHALLGLSVAMGGIALYHYLIHLSGKRLVSRLPTISRQTFTGHVSIIDPSNPDSHAYGIRMRAEIHFGDEFILVVPTKFGNLLTYRMLWHPPLLCVANHSFERELFGCSKSGTVPKTVSITEWQELFIQIDEPSSQTSLRVSIKPSSALNVASLQHIAQTKLYTG